jgi:ornithine cyclodeaminase/alanine dehydrogenase-like protein (mu-crystallin family)
VRPLKLVKIHGPVLGKAAEFPVEIGCRLRIWIAEVNQPKAAVTGGDIISNRARTTAPGFDGSRLDEGTHITPIGSQGPKWHEIDSQTVAEARFVVDGRDATLAGGRQSHPHCLSAMSKDPICSELRDRVTGAKPGRTSDEAITLYRSVGLSSQDGAAAQPDRVAADMGIGFTVEFEV